MHSDWPELDASYIDEFGPIDVDVYKAAGALWPSVRNDARAKLGDEAAGQRLLFKAAAAVSRQDLNQVNDLKAYLGASFNNLVRAELQERRRYQSADEELDSLPSPVAAESDKNILLDEIVRRMTPEMRRLYRLRTLGYSYERLAPLLGQPANVLRNKLSREYQRIKQSLLND